MALEDAGIYDGLPGRGSFILDGVTGKSTWAIQADQLEQLQNLFRRGAWRELYQLDPEWLSSYCATCDVNYCRDHWETELEFDDGFYDFTRGVCPRGHERVLTD